ncbi:Imm70 family immunity protein [Ureibacillus sp. FSL E2-3493]|uniref:Imm70 family immunity protein n=1 Tax=Ureibacillus sp. FSL E2-3493 TaxID=2921367 RepID=UPI00311A1CC6
MQKPPWGDKISSKVTNLANYFVTTDGKTFFEVIRTAMDVAEEDKCDLNIHKL